MRLPRNMHLLIKRLCHDTRGNVLIGFAAAVLPLMAMVGSAVDIARAYTVKTRLQNACDAASLAGRRVMLKDEIDGAVTSEATKFFNFNFPVGMFNTPKVTPDITRPAPGTVAITASTSVPTVLMRIFGFNDIPVSASCTAQQSFINVDVVMVLDTTGSMDDKLSSGQTKIEALRSAVMSFYKQLAPLQSSLEANGYRLRYAVVPYAQAVNVGKLLFAANQSYINQSNSAQYVRITGYSGNGSDPDISWISQGLPHSSNWIQSSSYNGFVEERKTTVTASATPTEAELARMTDLDVNLLPTNDATRWAPADPDQAFVQYGFAACPTSAVRLKAFSESEMQNYVNALAPGGGTYLDIGMIWGARFISDGGVFADSPLAFNGMRTNKYMVFLTDGEMEPQAISYSGYSVELMLRRVSIGTPNVSPVKRAFSAANAMKADLVARHTGRFDAMCQVVRNMGVSIWTIKLSDAAMDDHLKKCANVGQAATVSDQNALINQFSLIGKEISELRLTK
ncbi:pilus assembly protein TadG-related protein [Sphingomonas sp.]|uniref:TadE/TadG family type IV pilus assembly protein n=1 Tax=Sphingomonas sp. TaxID=28214 RepID=UPI0035C8231B